VVVRAAPGTGSHAGAREDDDARRLGLLLDLVGVVLAAALVLWTWVASAASGGDPEPSVLLVVAAGATVVGARVAGRLHRLTVPGILLAVAAGLAVASSSDILSRAPLSGPFGYVNAKAAFFAQVALAGLMLTAVSRRPGGRLLGVTAAAAAFVVPAASASRAAVALVIIVPLVALVVAGRWGPRVAATSCGALLLAGIVGTVGLGWTYSSNDRNRPVEGAATANLSQRRLVLWQEALHIAAEHPLTGIGPGRFSQVSPTARADRDARWAHHAFLQEAAEKGWTGLVVLVAVFGWGFARLAVSSGPPPVVALGAASLAVLGLHACADYVMHFAAVPIATAALVGTAMSARWADG
jgi:O-antigen ligase